MAFVFGLLSSLIYSNLTFTLSLSTKDLKISEFVSTLDLFQRTHLCLLSNGDEPHVSVLVNVYTLDFLSLLMPDYAIIYLYSPECNLARKPHSVTKVNTFFTETCSRGGS